MKGTVRLQKAIADAGVASRRAAEELIRQGRVRVNEQVVTRLGECVDPRKDRIRVDDRLIEAPSTRVYVLLYKPANCVTTVKDPEGRKTVFDHLPQFGVRLFPVGRLDYDAEGLLLLTNDGELAHRLQHPRHGVAKVYEVKIKGHASEEVLSKLRNGVLLEEGMTAPADVQVLGILPRAAWLRITLHQGWNRQLKRMGEAVGHPVLKIKRVGYAFLTLGSLRAGTWRELKEREVKDLRKLVGLEERQSQRT